MKIKNILKLFLFALSVFIISSCKKEAENIFTMFDDVTVTYNNSDPKCVVDYKQVTDNSEVWIDYTINSANEDIYSVTVERTTGTGFDRQVFTPTASQRRSYSNIFKYLFQRDGQTSFRVFARNQKGVYIGDGYKKVTVDVLPSYKFFPNRQVYLPDTVAKVLPSFVSLRTGEAFSYTNGLANSANIDFGIWRRPDNVASNPQYIYSLYATGAQPAAFNIYDVTAWTKRATKFSAQVASGSSTFLNNCISASTIETLAKARTINLDAITGTTAANGLTPGSIIYFQTPDLKYGVMLINSITSDYQKRPLMNVSIKVQN